MHAAPDAAVFLDAPVELCARSIVVPTPPQSQHTAQLDYLQARGARRHARRHAVRNMAAPRWPMAATVCESRAFLSASGWNTREAAPSVTGSRSVSAAPLAAHSFPPVHTSTRARDARTLCDQRGQRGQRRLSAELSRSRRVGVCGIPSRRGTWRGTWAYVLLRRRRASGIRGLLRMEYSLNGISGPNSSGARFRNHCSRSKTWSCACGAR